MFIVVEGVDCAGKGEFCPRLATALGAILYKTPPESMRTEQDKVNAEASDEDHYKYFVRVVQEASQELRDLTAHNVIVVDRYWMTTVVYHRVMGIPAKLEDFGNILMPDVTIYLSVSPEIQAKRMEGRGMSAGDRRMDGRQDMIRRIYDEVLASKRSTVLRINTSNLTPDEVFESAHSSILDLTI